MDFEKEYLDKIENLRSEIKTLEKKNDRLEAAMFLGFTLKDLEDAQNEAGELRAKLESMTRERDAYRVQADAAREERDTAISQRHFWATEAFKDAEAKSTAIAELEKVRAENKRLTEERLTVLQKALWESDALRREIDNLKFEMINAARLWEQDHHTGTIMQRLVDVGEGAAVAGDFSKNKPSPLHAAIARAEEAEGWLKRVLIAVHPASMPLNTELRAVALNARDYLSKQKGGG